LSLVERYREFYTYDDYKRWKGDWELIEGAPFAMSPSPSVKHQLLVSRLIYLLTRALEEEGCGRCFPLAEVDWVVREDTVVRPDVSVVCGELPLEGHLQRPPRLIFEVVSSTSIQRDEELKFELYKREGVELYGLVYPELRRLKLYSLKGSPELIFDGSSGYLKVPLEGCNLSLSLEELFKGL